MTHESDATALGRAAEEGNLGLVATQLLGVSEHGLPSGRRARVFVVLNSIEMSPEAGVGLDDTAEADMEQRNK